MESKLCLIQFNFSVLRFLLKQHLEYQAICARQTVQPIKVVLPPPEPLINPPSISVCTPSESPPKPKIPKLKVKKVSVGKAKKEAEITPVVEKPSSEEIKVAEIVDG